MNDPESPSIKVIMFCASRSIAKAHLILVGGLPPVLRHAILNGLFSLADKGWSLSTGDSSPKSSGGFGSTRLILNTLQYYTKVDYNMLQ